MISVKLEGRLGNQLFQYAFIYAASRKLDTPFYLDKSIVNFILPKYFEVNNDFLSPLDNHVFSVKGYKNIFSIHLKKAFYMLLRQLFFGNTSITVDNYTSVKTVLSILENKRQYSGYFYSAGYFEEVKADIKSMFRIKQKYINEFDQIKTNTNTSKKTAVIHVRRGDYVDLDIALPVTYYKKAIESTKGQDFEYIFISDDICFIESEFDYIDNKYISANDEIIDFQFLINADVCILSSSSFSWWGAWLNSKPNKQVYAPKYWLGFKEEKEFPQGVADNLDVNWIRL